jgi:hypothetical protein
MMEETFCVLQGLLSVSMTVSDPPAANESETVEVDFALASDRLKTIRNSYDYSPIVFRCRPRLQSSEASLRSIEGDR